MRVRLHGFWITVVLVISWLAMPSNAIAQSGPSPCGCADVPDLINLLNMDHAILDGLEEYEHKLAKDSDMMNDILPEPNPKRLTRGDQIRGVIQQQMNWLRNKAAHKASRESDTISCEWKAEGETPCLKSIVEASAIISKAFCMVYKEKNKMGAKDDTMNFMPVKTYLSHQREVYSREIPKILSILGSLSSCIPKDWFGSVTVYETRNQKSSAKNETTEDSTIRAGTILFDGKPGGPQSLWKIEGQYLNIKTGEETMRACKGGLATAKVDAPVKTSFKMDVQKHGGAVLKGSVDVGEPDEQNKVPIVVDIPELTVEGDGKSVSSRDSGCPDDSVKETNVITPNTVLSGETVEFKAVFIPKDSKAGRPLEQISGAGVIPGLSVSNPGFEMSHKDQVTIHLYRVSK